MSESNVLSREAKLAADLGIDFDDAWSSEGEGLSDGAEDIIDDARPRDKAEQNTDALTSKVTSLQQELTKLEQANAALEQRLKAQKQASMTMMTMSKQGYDAKLSHSSWVLQQCFEKLQRADEAASTALASDVTAILEKFEARPSKQHGGGSQSAASPTASAGAKDLEVQELKEHIAQLRTTNRQLQERLNTRSASEEESKAGPEDGASSAQIQQLQARIRQLEQQLASSQGQAPSPAAAGKDQTAEVEAARTAAKAAQSKVTELENRLTTTTSELESMRKQLTVLESGAGGAQAQVAELRDQLAAEKATAKTTLDETVAKYKGRLEKFKKSAQEQMDAYARDMEGKVQSQQQAATAAAAEAKALRSQSQGQRQAMQAPLRKTSTSCKQLRATVLDLRQSTASSMSSFMPALQQGLRQLTKQVLAKEAGLSGLKDRYRAEMLERKRLFNLVQELRGNIRVFCRVRPASKKELESGHEECVAFPEEGELQVRNAKNKSKSWEFDQVFRPGTNNAQVFEQTRDLVTSVLDGYNVCIFAYGQTGSGKTHTMEGPPDDRGVNYRSLFSLFDQVRERSEDVDFELSMSMLEIYNETIGDMLNRDDVKLTVREHPKEGVHVPGLTINTVSSAEAVVEIMGTGYRNRTTFATDMNEHSSRSHCIVSVYVQARNKITGTVSSGKLHMIDLAGSERVGKSAAAGQRLVEAQHINKSLSALGDVIQSRVKKTAHVPFRNSVLTRLLQDSLSGNSKTLMFVNVSPVIFNAEESFCSLNFAARARNVELGKAAKNIVDGAGGGGGRTKK